MQIHRLAYRPRFLLACSLFLAIHAAPARAEDSPAPRSLSLADAARPSSRSSLPSVSLGVNAPFMWAIGNIGGSLSLGVHQHHALRVSAASYHPVFSPFRDYSSDSRLVDVSAGWVFYPRRLWSGFSLELGGLMRDRDITFTDAFLFRYQRTTHTDTRTFAGRALLGWSWRYGDHFFLSAAAGVSVGHERGARTVTREESLMPTTSDVDEHDVSFETNLRLGVAFD